MPQRRVVLHCNAGGPYGMGHLMRCLAIAEEAISRGWIARLGGDLSPEAVRLTAAQSPLLTTEVVRRSAVGGWLAAADADVVHIDSYWPEADHASGTFLRSNMQDGLFGARDTDLAIDANLGAEHRFTATAKHALVGISAVPIRAQVRRYRGRTAGELPRRVLIVLGGTDPHGLTADVVAALGAITTPLTVTVVSPEAQRDIVSALAQRIPHPITITEFLTDLPAVAARQDLVISASGTSVWDFACMGVPTAVLCVADNQRAGYDAVVKADLAFGLGMPPHHDLVDRLRDLDGALGTPGFLDGLRERGRELVDGLGVWRIVSAWEQLLESPAAEVVDADVTTRPATGTDALLLHGWRNDPTTRRTSRSGDEVPWDDHLRWLDRVLRDPTRQLLIAERAGAPVGTIRWDHLGGRDWEVSITVAPEVRGRGLAAPLLRAGEDALRVDGGARLIATVHVDNVPSRRLFQRAGYLPLTPPDGSGFATSVKWRPATAGATSTGSPG